MKPSELSSTLEFCIKNHYPVLIAGSPGIGKSDIVTKACENLGVNLIISHPVVSDPTDYKGLPFVVDGHAEFLPFGDLRKLIEATEETVFFLDDLGQAPASVQASAMQLLLARQINGHRVSDKVTFVSATNRREDRAGVQGILEPVKSRFASIIELTVDHEDWIKWAIENDMPVELIAFLRFRPDFINDFKPTREMKNSPCPRTIAFCGKMINQKLPKELEFEVFCGAVGEGFTSEFIAFLKIYRNLPNIDVLIKSPETADVPSDVSTLYALTGALANKANDKNFASIMKYIDRLPTEYGVLFIKDATNRNQKLTYNKAHVDWTTKHYDVLV
jgi:hypothetical protein